MWKSICFLLLVFMISVFSTSSLLVRPVSPPGSIGPYANGIFSSKVPGEASSWELEDYMPDLTVASPLRIISLPNSSDILVLSKIGEVWRISSKDQTKELVLDIKDRSVKKGEAGSTGIALHPQFGMANAADKQHLFVFYRSKPEPDVWGLRGVNRLSKFTWDEVTNTFDKNSEEILIQQYDRHSWHNGGGMFFGADGFLYLSVGDEGGAEFQAESNQRLDGGFFGGVLRIDVDNDPSRSHPIRRQPIFYEVPPSEFDGWETFSQGYSIPNDNPWLSPDSTHLEEFYAIGVRSPYSLTYDRENDQVWLADVGSNIAEEVNKIDRGDNLQWPYMEGDTERPEHQRPDNLIGKEKGVFFKYGRDVGLCIIGGGVYRGTAFPNLNGKYIFADYSQDKLMALSNTDGDTAVSYSVLISGFSSLDTELPETPGITGIFPQPDGEVLITITGKDFFQPSKIVRLKQKGYLSDPPALLSELGIFDNLDNLEPIQGFIPYSVNAPLWSDRAVKKRWIAIPNDGHYDSPEEQIHFESLKDWQFPEGTVFIKHFDLPTTTNSDGPTRRLETRFFIKGEDQIAYGLTYIWNEEGTDALLNGGGTSKNFPIYEDGEIAFTQTWKYPGRDQCMTCHNSNANFVLGVKAHQLNGELFYPDINQTVNQLTYLNDLNIFDKRIGRPENYSRAHHIDDENIDLGVRVRSYLDSNCSSCHRPGAHPNVTMDLRFTTPLELQEIINASTNSEESPANQKIVKPGSHATSELWIRDASLSSNRMPPLSRKILDQNYLDKLAEWIDGLSENAGKKDQFFIYPNPGFGHLVIQLPKAWEPPLQLALFSMNGQLMNEFEMDTHVTNMDFSTYPPGIYLMKTVYQGESYFERLVISNSP